MKSYKLALVACVAVVGMAGMIGCTSSQTQESTGQFVDSSAVTVKVKAALLKDDKIKSFPITVNTYKNGVQLSGYVNSPYQKVRAGEIARSVEGVQEVDNAIIVKRK